MSDLFDDYPMLMVGIEILIPLLVVTYIVVYVNSGRKGPKRPKRQERQKQHERTPRRPD